MRLSSQFSVDAPVGVVWNALTDLERVAPCMPGARVLEKLDAARYRVGMSVKLGPMTLDYEGEVEVLERDPVARRARLSGSARERRGQGTASSQVAFALAPQGDGTRADIEMDVQLSGRAASLGQGLVQQVAAKLVGDFSSNLARLCASADAEPPAAEPLDAAEVAGAVARRVLTLPRLVAVVLVLAVLILARVCR